MIPISYYQTDPRWNALPYAVAGEKSTIGKSGCGPACMAMVLATLKNDPKITPETECKWSVNHGFKAKGQGTYYGYFESRGLDAGVKVRQVNGRTLYGDDTSNVHEKMRAWVRSGNWVIACMGPGNWTRSGHFVLVYDIKGNTVYLRDPASSKKARTEGSYSLFKKQVKYYFTIEVPKTVPEKVDKEGEDMVYYEKLTDVPAGDVRNAVKFFVDKGVVRGTDTGLHLSDDMCRVLTYIFRMYKLGII